MEYIADMFNKEEIKEENDAPIGIQEAISTLIKFMEETFAQAQEEQTDEDDEKEYCYNVGKGVGFEIGYNDGYSHGIVRGWNSAIIQARKLAALEKENEEKEQASLQDKNVFENNGSIGIEVANDYNI